MSAVVQPTSLDRLWQSFRALVHAELPTLRFLGTYEYTIRATDGATVDASPNDTTQGLPQVNKLPLRADSIATQTPTVGNVCHVLFVNGDPSRPVCTWCAPPPTSVAIAGGGPAVARVGDSTNPGYIVLSSAPATTQVNSYFPGTSIGHAAAIAAAAALSPPGTVQSMAGAISSGSGKVTSG